MRIPYLVSAAASTLILVGCSGGSDGGTEPNPPGGGPPGGPASVVASASANEFSPVEVKIRVGETVRWSFGSLAHNVSFAPVTGAPTNIAETRNAQVSRTFSTQGSFPYDCTLHPGMRARVLVGVEEYTPPPGY